MSFQDTDSDYDWIHTGNLQNTQPIDELAEDLVSERLSLVDEEYLVDLNGSYNLALFHETVVTVEGDAVCYITFDLFLFCIVFSLSTM